MSEKKTKLLIGSVIIVNVLGLCMIMLFFSYIAGAPGWEPEINNKSKTNDVQKYEITDLSVHKHRSNSTDQDYNEQLHITYKDKDNKKRTIRLDKVNEEFTGFKASHDQKFDRVYEHELNHNDSEKPFMTISKHPLTENGYHLYLDPQNIKIIEKGEYKDQY
jgi:hypothetical protein